MNPAAPVTTMYTVSLLQFEVDRGRRCVTTNGTRGATAQSSSYPTVDAALRDVVDRQALAPEDDRAADVRFGHVGDVDGDHVHRHAAREARLLAAHEHRRSVRREARIAVGVAAGDDADAAARASPYTSRRSRRVSLGRSDCTAMISERSVITGRTPIDSAESSANGVAP